MQRDIVWEVEPKEKEKKNVGISRQWEKKILLWIIVCFFCIVEVIRCMHILGSLSTKGISPIYSM